MFVNDNVKLKKMISVKVTLKSQDEWNSKMYSVIFVNSQKDKELLWELLVKQDRYWGKYPDNIDIIKVRKDFTFTTIRDIQDLCEYCGKVDIYDVEELQKQVDLFIYQYDGMLY
jgi:hypothetical protein